MSEYGLKLGPKQKALIRILVETGLTEVQRKARMTLLEVAVEQLGKHGLYNAKTAEAVIAMRAAILEITHPNDYQPPADTGKYAGVTILNHHMQEAMKYHGILKK